MLDRIQLKFGSYPGTKPLSFGLSPVTVFVGPNNSGKSLVLREIEQVLNNGAGQHHSIVDQIFAKHLDPEVVKQLIEGREVEPPPDTAMGGRTLVVKNDPTQAQVRHLSIEKGQILQIFRALSTDSSANPTRELLWQRDILPNFVSLYAVRLDGKSRFALTEVKKSGNFLGAPQNHLMALFQNDEAREELREATDDAFGLHAVLDPHSHGNLRIRMSDRPPADPSEEQNWDGRSRAFHTAATEIERFSDGVKAFTGLVAAVLSDDFRVIMVDEPDAFLHPTLAKKLGGRLATLASERDANVIASTHSSDFLMGCVEAGSVGVVRLTYRNRVPTARHLASKDLERMTNDPLLRSTGVLSGLFYEGVIVCESDADRSLYQEVNHRLLASKERGSDNTLFLNAYEKSTVRRIVRPLREMGIPAAAVVDLDILKDKQFSQLLRDAFVPEALIKTWNTQRSYVEKAFKREGLEMRHVGVDGLPKDDQAAVRNLLDNVAQYGVFVVPVGELERWFEVLQRRPDMAKKSGWVTRVFELMNTDPELFEIGENDVWGFMRKMAAWISDPDRQGIPT